VYAQVDVVDESGALEADAILVSTESLPDLILKDIEFIETRLGRNPAEIEKAALLKIQAHLENNGRIATATLSPEELQAVAAHSFYTNKPVIVATAQEMQDPDALLVRAFVESGWICFLTLGGKENRAWPIRKGTTALQAAGSIHTDMQKGFIRAEIIGYADLIANGGETGAKRAGKLRLETKEYVMQDCDVTNFRFSK
jgi:hypothetical protein